MSFVTILVGAALIKLSKKILEIIFFLHVYVPMYDLIKYVQGTMGKITLEHTHFLILMQNFESSTSDSLST